MDWMTAVIEVMGAAIFCVWVVIPIREYRSIYQRLRHQKQGHGLPVTAREDPSQENRA